MQLSLELDNAISPFLCVEIRGRYTTFVERQPTGIESQHDIHLCFDCLEHRFQTLVHLQTIGSIGVGRWQGRAIDHCHSLQSVPMVYDVNIQIEA